MTRRSGGSASSSSIRSPANWIARTAHRTTAAALPGFSIANGRLAWATPPGQDGEGSRVQVVAWTDDAVGAVESGPVENVVVIH